MTLTVEAFISLVAIGIALFEAGINAGRWLERNDKTKK